MPDDPYSREGPTLPMPPRFVIDIAGLDLYTADEIFLTGTGAEVMPVTKVDGRQVGDGKPGPLTKRLLEAFHRYVREG